MREARNELARRSFVHFIKAIKGDSYVFNWHHTYLANKLDAFARGEIKKLMVFMPPQHGKSELCSRLFPAFYLGLNPDKRVAGCSYAHSLAAKFNRDIQRIMTSPIYKQIFPDSQLNARNVRSDAEGSWLRNSDEFEVVNKKGGYLSVGVGGGLTGNRVDLGIIDDPVKDPVEAQSTTTQQRNWEWYTDVFEARLDNNAQQLIIMTRWEQADLCGLILKNDRDKEWDIVMFPAIKEDDSNPDDPRQIGEALWEEKHSAKKILAVREKSPKTFNSLYQQNPKAPEEILVFPDWKVTHTEFVPEDAVFGLDWGFSNSMLAVVGLNIDHKRKEVIAKEYLYTLGMNNYDLATFLYESGIKSNQLIYADGAEVKSVDELRLVRHQQYGNIRFNIVGVKKFPNSVNTMILKLKEYTVKYTSDSRNIAYETSVYQWMIGAEGKPTDREHDKNNHLVKAIMYAVWQDSGGKVEKTKKSMPKIYDILEQKKQDNIRRTKKFL